MASPGANCFAEVFADDFVLVDVDVAFSGAGEAVVNYQLKLSDQAGDCNGSSQHSRLSPGNGVSQTGQQNVPVPANQIIEIPNITVAKLVDRADVEVAEGIELAHAAEVEEGVTVDDPGDLPKQDPEHDAGGRDGQGVPGRRP